MNRDKSNTVAVPVIGVSLHRLLTDGHGVTTLVAFHGCPLKCKYCLRHLTGIRCVQTDKIVLRIPIITGYVTPEEAEETRRSYELRGFTRFDISPNAEPDTLEGEAIPHPGYIPPDNDATELGGKISFFQEKFKRVFFKECAVAGVSFHLKYNDELWDELETGVKLALVRERKNKYDKNAVAVALADDFDGDHDNFDFDFILGYIPRECNSEIAAMMDAGYDDKFEAEISTFKRHGSLNDRIRITIWLLSKEPEVVRPDLLRIQYLNHSEMRGMLDELQDRGTVHFRWGGFPPWERNLPEVGDEVVFMNHHFSSVLIYHMRVLAIGDDARPYLEDPTETEWIDDCAPYVLTNIAGPIRIRFDNSLNFLKSKRLEDRVVYDWLEPDESDLLKRFIKMKSELWLSRNNVDTAPSIDDPIEY